MATKATPALLQHVRSLLDETLLRQATDRQLLDRYVSQRDQAAFAKLVERHGPLVFRVCQRILHESHSAEDAFQATFFVLARKAQALGKKEGLGPWLYGVASRIALHARADAARRYRREQRAESRGPADPYAEATGRELCAVLEEELNRLPERYRTPFRLCYVEGQTRDQVAGQLGGSLRTLHRRLEHGRKLLQAALTRRGVTLAAALVATDLIQRSSAATLTAFLRLATVKAALHFAEALRSERVSLSAQAVTLAQSVLQGMALAKITIAGMAILALALGTTGVGLMVHSSASHQSQTLSRESQPASPPPVLASTEPPGDSGARVDLLGDPLPAGALARLGSSRWRLDSSGADALVCSSDGETLVTANATTGITLWDMATGKAVRQLPGDAQRQEWLQEDSAIALAANGQAAALAGRDGHVHWLHLPTGLELRRIPGSPQEIALSADGRTLATQGETLQVWERDSGKRMREIPFHAAQRRVNHQRMLALAPDGKTLACVDHSPECIIHVFDVASGTEKQKLGACKGRQRHVVFSPDGHQLLAADAAQVQLWDLSSGHMLHTWEHRHFAGLTATAFAPDGESVLLLREDLSIRRMDTRTGQQLARLPVAEISSKLGLFAFTPDGQTLVHATAGRPVLWRYDLATGKAITSPGELPTIGALGFAPDERFLYTLSRDRKLRAWEVDTGKELHQSDVGSSWGIFSPDGRLLAVLQGGTIHVYETATGQQRWQALVDAQGRYPPWAFSPNGDRLVAVADGSTIVIWDAATGKELHRRVTPGIGWWHIQFTAEGTGLVGVVAAGGAAMTYSLDPATGRTTPGFSLPRGSFPLECRLDGKHLWVGRQDAQPFPCYDLVTGKRCLEKIAVRHPPATPCFSPAGDLLLVAEEPGTVQVFDVYAEQVFHQREVHRGLITSMVFSPSGRRLATLSNDQTGLVWSTQGFLWPDKVSSLPFTRPEFDSLWADLAAADAAKVHRAMGRMIAVPKQTTAFLRQQLQPMLPVPANDLERLSRELNSAEFQVRRQATDVLVELGDRARPAVEKLLLQPPSLEARQRAEQLLSRLDASRSAAGRRVLWAVRILEYLGTPEAEQQLQKLARGVPEARLTQEAQAALERLARASR